MLTPGAVAQNSAGDQWVVYEGGEGPGADKHIVLISGDEEYRSEETLTQLAKILSRRHGFRSTVLFAIDPNSGIINPHVRDNIPGLENLQSADLVVVFTRWRVLPDDQMERINAYLRSGKPVVGFRTATHAFAPPPRIHRQVLSYLQGVQKAEGLGEKPPPVPAISEAEWGRFGHFGDGYFGPKHEWRDGFGRFILGERWVAHHGRHKHESTRGVIAPGARNHPVNRGIRDGDIWGPTDVYTVRLPLPGDAQPLVLGQVLARVGQYNEEDPYYGMRPDDGPPVAEKNDPMMPVAWTKSYQLPGGPTGRAFVTTMGASTDFASEGVRRLVVNGIYWALGMEEQIPAQGTNVDTVGNFQPTRYENHPSDYWTARALRPSDLR